MKQLSWKIGGVKIMNPVTLAPMEAVNCASFRLMCKWAGAGLVYTDMIDTKQFLTRLKENEDDESKTVQELVNPRTEERPLTVQLGGGEPEDLAMVAQIVEKCADIIDLNCGCPLGYMTGRKGGAYMLKENWKLGKMFGALKDTVRVPVTAKIRCGWKRGEENAEENAKLLEELGADAIAVHARTAKDRYRTSASENWRIIKSVKESVSIPVLGNGDVSSGARAVTLKGQTGCDAVMIGRAAQGHPEIFSQAVLAFSGRRYEERTRDATFSSFLTFLDLYKTIESRSRLGEIQDHAIWWVSGQKDAAQLKQQILSSKSMDDLRHIFGSD